MNNKSTNNYAAPQCDIVEVVLEGAILDVSKQFNESTSTDDSGNWGFVKNN